ncbi:MAG: class IV adenylate cyclase [Acidobacteria bacterium]|nr:class IV adenylate cyclase [Acidobacteriota bacterium]
MPIEIEKKYRLTEEQAESLRGRLNEAVGAPARGVEFEESTLYAGAGLAPSVRALRLRRVGGRAVLTLKERQPSADAIKHQREEEIGVSDAATTDAILRALGYAPALVYEKRRETWRLGDAEVVLDELPFGWFAEIEGDRDAILRAEQALGLDAAEAELRTYPTLTRERGARRGDLIEARFGGN